MRLTDWLSSVRTCFWWRSGFRRRARRPGRFPRRSACMAGLSERLEERTVLSGVSVSALSLVNDTGTIGDSITEDPRISVMLDSASPEAIGYVWIQYDLNGDAVPDSTSMTMGLGSTIYDLRSVGLNHGSISVAFRAGEWDNSISAVAYTSWANMSIEYVPPPMPVVNGLTLVNDTGTSGDLITTDARVSGSLTLSDSSPLYLPVQYDYNNDGVVDGTISTDMMGQFVVDLRNLNLPDGSRSVKVRGGRYLNGPMMATYGEWSTFTFTNYVPPPVLPAVASLALLNDTGTPGDLVTTDARISGSLTLADSSPSYLPVQYDYNNDGVVDGTIYTDMMGQFIVDLQKLESAWRLENHQAAWRA